jgi:hypothetical protein
MAKKPQRLSQSLGRLRALEQDTAVVASPVDTFTRQAAVTESTRAREIERGLSQLSPVIGGYFKEKREQQREEGIKEGITRYRNATEEERKADIKQIESGDPRQSEFWMEGYARSYLEDKADSMATDFGIAFAEQSENPNFDYDQFADEYVRNYTLQNGLDAFDDDLLIDNYYGRIDGVIAQRRQNYNEKQIAKVTEEREALYEKDISRAFDGAISDEGGVNFDTLSGSINALVEHRIATGGKASTIIDSTVNGLTAIGSNMADNGLSDWETVLDVMANIKNRFGTYGETTTGRLNIERLRQQFEAAEDAADDDVLKQQKASDELETRAIRQGIVDALEANSEISVEIRNSRSKALIEVDGRTMTLGSAMRRLFIIDRVEHDSLRTFGSDYDSIDIKTDPSTLAVIDDMIFSGLASEADINRTIDEFRDRLSTPDIRRLRKDAKDSSVLKNLFTDTGATAPYAQIKDLYKNPFSGGFLPDAVQQSEKFTNEYNVKFQAWRGQNDISTPEGKAAFFDWHQSTMADIINRAKPVTKTETPKFWEDTSKYKRQDIYSLYRYAQDAGKRKQKIHETDLGKLMIAFVEAEKNVNPDTTITVTSVHNEIANWLGE